MDHSGLRGALNSRQNALVLFSANWCPFCLRFKRLCEQTEAELSVEMFEANLNDPQSPLWREFNIDVIPTLVLFRDGMEVLRKDGRLGSGLTKKDLTDILLAYR